MDKEGSLVTKLNAQIVFIDGIREDPFCELVKGSKSDASTWNVRIGVDFVSGGSNTVHIHVQQCLDYVRDQLGYAIKQGDKIVVIPPKKVLDKLRESEIPDAIDLDMQQTLLKAHEEVELDGKCPKNIEAYIILMNVYNQVKDKKMDYVVINDQLNKNRNGAGRVQSCAFSREWNKRYQESASFECDIDNDRCLYRQENDGNSEWSINYENDRFEYINKKFLFFNLNPKRIHKGGVDQKGMAGLALTDRAGQRSVGFQKPAYGHSGKKGNIHRGKKNAAAFVFQIAQADFGGIEHLRGGIVFVAKENQSAPGQMPLQLLGIVACDDHDLSNAGLMQRRHDALSNRDGADVQHGFEITHTG